jgi:hypothetical protein
MWKQDNASHLLNLQLCRLQLNPSQPAESLSPRVNKLQTRPAMDSLDGLRGQLLSSHLAVGFRLLIRHRELPRVTERGNQKGTKVNRKSILQIDVYIYIYTFYIYIYLYIYINMHTLIILLVISSWFHIISAWFPHVVVGLIPESSGTSSMSSQ